MSKKEMSIFNLYIGLSIVYAFDTNEFQFPPDAT